MTKQEQRIIAGILEKLRAENATQNVQEAFAEAAPYLDTYIVGPLETLIEDDRPKHAHKSDLETAERILDVKKA